MTDTPENLTAQVLTMADLVAYQPGSVVSRTVIDKKVGTITLFAFGEGQGLSEHTAPYDAFVQIVDGEAAITIAGTPSTLQAGQMIIMPANKPHSLKATKKFNEKNVFLMTDPDSWNEDRPLGGEKWIPHFEQPKAGDCGEKGNPQLDSIPGGELVTQERVSHEKGFVESRLLGSQMKLLSQLS